MNVFIKRVIIFIFIAKISLILFSYLILLFSPQKNSIYNKGKKVEGKKVYIFGNSHPECAINDSLLPSKYLNLSKSAQPLFYTSAIIQNVINHLYTDTIIIEFGNNALNSIYWVFDETRFSFQYQKYFSLMSFKQHKFLINNNFNNSILTLLFPNPKDIINSNNIEGGYLYLAKNFIITPSKVKSETNTQQTFDPKIESNNLESLITLIQNNPTKTFILTRMPLHHNFYTNERDYKNNVKILTKFRNVRYIDFVDKVKLADSCFADSEHLNYKGAKVFTPIFYSLITNKTN